MTRELAWRRVRWEVAPRGAAVRHGGWREAVLVELRGEDGTVIGVGEAAPLPGMSRETIDDVLEELAAYGGGEELRSPALEFALAAARAGDGGVRSVRSAIVVDDDAQARAAVRAGAPALKVKVGRGGADEDVARVAAIAAAAPGVALRLDANRAWSLVEVPARLAALADVASIAWVEEPCVGAIGLLGRGLALPIALDESLGELADDEIDRALATAPRLGALVLKPTLLGMRRCVALATRARERGVAAIISHALEGPVGYRACVALARVVGGEVPHGVGPHAALDGWTLPSDGGWDLARVVAAAPADPALSITQAAHSTSPGVPAIVTADATLTFAACAAAARTHAPVDTLVATPTLATLHSIHAALEARRPLALLHHRLAPAELARQRELVAAATIPADTAFVLFTSGSTGAPRGVVIPRAAIAAAADASAARLAWRDDDRWLLALSLAHTGGLAVAVRCLIARRPIVLVDHDFAPDRCAALIADRAVTLASLVPTQLAALLDDPAWRPPPQLRVVLLGGASAPATLVEAALARGVPVLATYGATETFGQVATARVPAGPLVALPGIAITAAAADAPTPAPIIVRGPTLATCYLDGEPIAPAFVTPDLGWVTDTTPRELRIAGRRDDVIITGGMNVHPAEVEAVLAATPGVRAAIAFGIADARWGQLVAAAVAVDTSFDHHAAIARWRAALPSYARPRRLAIRDALPLLPTGKLDRRAAAALPSTDVDYDA